MSTMDVRLHWADQYAAQIVRERADSTQKAFVCAAGISPSGTVHVGNFREIISVDLVVRALRTAGHTARFVYFWDDMDALRAIPANLPTAAAHEILKQHLRQPIGRLPDPFGVADSYARRNELEVEQELPRVGIRPEFIYQAQRYAASAYAEMIRHALRRRTTIVAILNRHRERPLADNWWPISIFSSFSGRDTTTIEEWDGEWKLTYQCNETKQRETIDMRSSPNVKLLWRVDWPMRWAFEQVAFEPAGKDHHSDGGAFATATEIVSAVYGKQAPVSFQYDFIRIKGQGGKMSSSSGKSIGIGTVLEIYQPEVLRYMFASTRPNSEFAISFDLDVIKIYEDYDRCERIYFGREAGTPVRAGREQRIYELAQTEERIPQYMPLQIPFRHVCSLVQIVAGDIDYLIDNLPQFGISGEDAGTAGGADGADGADGAHGADGDSRTGGLFDARSIMLLRARARCAWNWVCNYAPEAMRFQLQSGDEAPIVLAPPQRAALSTLYHKLKQNWTRYNEQSLGAVLYEVAQINDIKPKEFFMILYTILIGKSSGPRLAGFIRAIGTIARERLFKLLEHYRMPEESDDRRR